MEQSDTESVLRREIRRRLAERLDGVEGMVLDHVMPTIPKHQPADQVGAVMKLSAVIDACISEVLAEVADRMPVGHVQEFMRREMPDDPRIDALVRAGVNREMNYVWARPADGERGANGTFVDRVVVRISPISLLTRAV